MTDISEVRRSNEQFAAEGHANNVLVFVGATNGIGEGTLQVMLERLKTPTVYIVGRSESRWKEQEQRLRKLNEQAKLHFIHAEVSLIREVDKTCKEIAATTDHVDYLCMSCGYLPLCGYIGTPEGLETCFVLQYYARMRFLQNLMPLLQKSPSPSVLSILAAGKERKIAEDDLNLDKKGWSIFGCMGHMVTMTTLTLDYFCKQNPDMRFVHAWPGSVKVDVNRKPSPDAKTSSTLFIYAYGAFRWVMRKVFFDRLAISREESGQRHMYLMTNERFKPGTVWRTDIDSSVFPELEQLETYRKDGMPEKVFEHNQTIFKRALDKDVSPDEIKPTG